MAEPLGIHDRADGEREYYTMPMRYDPALDGLVPVTEEWVQFVQRQFYAFGAARAAAKKVVGNGYAPADVLVALNQFLDAWRPEFEQKPEQS